MGRLQNKVAVVTGGASGMGRATVLRFLDEGAKVVIADFNAATGEDTVAEAARGGYADAVRFIRTDVAKEADIEAMIRLARDAFGSVDIVFNNAGVGGAIGPLTETTVDAWDYTFDVLAKGVFLGIKHAARAMREQGRGGSIINTASIAGSERRRRTARVFRRESRGDQPQPVGRGRTRRRSHPRQFDLPGVHRHAVGTRCESRCDASRVREVATVARLRSR